jgi:hypothetical protein
MKERTIWYEYFDVTELPVGDLPYIAVKRALKDEEYMRKFTPTFARNDLMQGRLAALLYWYPYYVTQLFEMAGDGHDYMIYFRGLPTEIIDGFNYLFPELKNRLDKVKGIAVNLNSLEEMKLKKTTYNKKPITA